MNLKIIYIFLLFGVFSCSKPVARKPITHKTSTSFFEESIQLNKKIIIQEEATLKNYIINDSLNDYKTSAYGFWFKYDKKNLVDTKKPIKGSEVIINYQISDLENNIILSEKELGTKDQEKKEDRLVKIDGEDFILGLHEGIKLMKEGEIVTFLLPSNKAFGATGLGSVIAPNEPLVIKVKLKKIINNQ